MKKKVSAVLFLKSQPIHTGEIITVLTNINNYNHLCLCVSAKASVTPLNKVYATWSIILQHYKKKVSIMFLNADPTELTKNLPKDLRDSVLLTYSQAEFTHLSSLNLPVKLLPRVLGYQEVFLRTAYRQSRALDWLFSKGITSTQNTTCKKFIDKNEEENLEVKK